MLKILQMVDECQIAFRPAVESFYLYDEQQYTLLEAMGYNDAAPFLAQAIKMKKFMQEGKLTDGVIRSIIQEEKPNQKDKPGLRCHAAIIACLFPCFTTISFSFP